MLTTIEHTSQKKQKRHSRYGRGILNTIINKLPFELHIPGMLSYHNNDIFYPFDVATSYYDNIIIVSTKGYQYAGPGTHLKKRLARGDPGINPLDAACEAHDIAYAQNQNDIAARNIADDILAEEASKRIFAKDSSMGERTAAVIVSNAMKVKSKFGMGCNDNNFKNMPSKSSTQKKKKQGPSKKKNIRRKKKQCPQRKKKVSFQKIIQAAKQAMKNSTQGSMGAIKSALDGARSAIKSNGGKSNIITPRVLPVASSKLKHVGGALPLLIPILSAVSAIGGLVGGASGIMKAISGARSSKEQLTESIRHNTKMEEIALGWGLYISPYKSGMGLYLTPKNLN